MSWSSVTLYAAADLLSESCAPFLARKYTSQTISTVYMHTTVKDRLSADVFLAVPELKTDMDLYLVDTDFAVMKYAARYLNVIMILENVYELAQEHYKNMHQLMTDKYDAELEKIVLYVERKIGAKGGIQLAP